MKQKIADLSTIYGFQHMHQHQRKMRINGEGKVRSRKIITKSRRSSVWRLEMRHSVLWEKLGE